MRDGEEPSLMSIRSPCFWEREWRERCGDGPRRWMLPMIGHGVGPGGSFRGRGRWKSSRERKASAAMRIRAERDSW